MTLSLLSLTVLLTLQGSQASDATEAAVRAYMSGLGREVSARSLADIGSREDWERRRDLTRSKLLSALGLDPMPERTPLEARVTGTVDRAEFEVLTLIFKALPEFYLTANLYLPKDGKAKHPGILYVCDHAPDPRGAKVRYQHHPVWLASHGYVVLIVDPIQISEIEAIHHGTYRYGHWHWNALGYTRRWASRVHGGWPNGWGGRASSSGRRLWTKRSRRSAAASRSKRELLLNLRHGARSKYHNAVSHLAPVP